MVSALLQKEKNGRKLTKLLSWKSVQAWVENLSNYVAQHNWTDFQRKKMVFFFFFFFFFEKSHSPCRRKTIFENKNNKKRNFWTDFQLKKGQNLDRFSTLQHIYIYIYTYLRLLVHTPFCHSPQSCFRISVLPLLQAILNMFNNSSTLPTLIITYVKNLVLEYMSKLRTSKSTFDLGFRLRYFDYAG